MAAFQAGIKIRERFEIITIIGSGGFGEVWQGVDSHLLRDIAIKRILGFGNAHNKRQEMIEEATKIAAVPPHAHIVSVYDAFDHDGEVLVVMELLHRGSLETLLKTLSRKGRWVDPNTAFRLIRGILDGLAAMHNSQLGMIIHKDLKPSNILFDHNGRPKIADFGIASVGTVDALPTVDRGLLQHEGTHGYKSPEQMRGLRLDQRTDLFNVGLIAYLLFGAAHPFVDARFLFDYQEMVLEPYRHLPPVSADGLPPALAEFISCLLAINPDDRFQSANEALAELDDIESQYQNILFDRVIGFHDVLFSGIGDESFLSPQELAEGIALCKRRGFYVQGMFLYERSGIDFDHLTEGTRVRLEEDYRVCKRRAGQEVVPPL
jgi:serine/threonine-protein kinase